MKRIKKGLLLISSLCLIGTLSLAACGGEEDDSSTSQNQGGANSSVTSSVDQGNEKGEQISASEWATAITSTFEADNVTVNRFRDSYSEDESGNIYGKGFTGTTKIADGMMHEKLSWTESVNGLVRFFTEERYVFKIDDTYYEWYKDSVEQLEWRVTPGFVNADFSMTVENELMEGFSKDALIAAYEQLQFDETTGEYSLPLEIEDTPFTLKIKIADEKIYTLTGIFYGDETQGAVEFDENKFVFVNYGTTSIGKLPNEEDEPDSGDNSQSGSNSESGGVGGGEVELPDLGDVEIPDVDGEQVKDEAAWKRAWANTNAATNLTAIATQSEGDHSAVGVVMIADGKQYGYWTESDGAEMYMYTGEVNGQSYEWYSADGKNWEVENAYMSPAEYATGVYIVQGLDQTLDFSSAVYENGEYTIETFGNVFKIKIANDYVVSIYMTGEKRAMSFVIEYGKASVGSLPALGDSGEVGGDNTGTSSGSGSNSGEIGGGDNTGTSSGNGSNSGVGGGDEVNNDLAWLLQNTMNCGNFSFEYVHTAQYPSGIEEYFNRTGKVTENLAWEELARETLGGETDTYERMERYGGWSEQEGAFTYSYDGETWTKSNVNEIAEGFLADMQEGFYQFMGMSDLFYGSLESGMFSLDEGDFYMDGIDRKIRNVQISFNGDYVTEVRFIMEADEFEMSIVMRFYDFNETNLTLPEFGDVEGDDNGGGEVDVTVPEMNFDKTLGDNILGEQVTEEEFEEYIQNTYASTNFSVYEYMDGGLEVKAVGDFADGKMYSVAKITGEMDDGSTATMTQFTYAGRVDGVSYVWMSMDGKTWENDLADDMGLVGYENGAYFSRYLSQFRYADCTYDKVTGAYAVTFGEGLEGKLKFVDGKVAVMIILSTYEVENGFETTTERFVLEYGHASVGELPPVDLGGNLGGSGSDVSQEQWTAAFDGLLSGTNLEARVVTEQNWSDGSMEMAIVQYSLDGDTLGYVYEMTDAEGVMTTSRYVWTVENGLDTQYTFSNETGLWVKEDSATVSGSTVWSRQIRDLDIFANLYGQMAWSDEYGCFYMKEFTYVSTTGQASPTYYDVCVMIMDGYVTDISFKIQGTNYETVVRYFFYGYNETTVTIPVDGGENGDYVGGDIVDGGENGDYVVDEGIGDVIVSDKVTFN